MDFDFDPCSVCSIGDGLYCCKICNLKYCSDHLCLHLSVAWETNTWTSRNSREDIDDSNLSTNNETSNLEKDKSGLGRNSPSQNNSNIQINAKTILSYTEAQLEAQLEFYNAQARRIRRELERRSLSLSNLQTSGQKFSIYSNSRSKRNNERKSNKLPKKQQNALDVLSNQVRAGNISIEQLKQILESK